MPAIDRYAEYPSVPYGPARTLFAIAPADGVELPYLTAALYVGGAGDLAVTNPATGATVIFKGVPAGSILPVRVAVVPASGTTATHIVGMA